MRCQYRRARRRGATGSAGRGGRLEHVSEEENKALVRRWLDAMDRGDLDAVDDLIAPDYVDHSPPIPGLPPGKEGIRAANLLLAAAFTDVVHTVEEQIASG